LRPEEYTSPRVSRLVLAYILFLPLLFLSAHGMFSFEQAGHNTDLGHAFGALVENGVGSDGGRFTVERDVVLAITILVLFSRRRDILRCCLESRVLAALPLLAVMSMLWSQYPELSRRTGTYLLLNTLFAFYIFKRFRPEQVMELLMMVGIGAIGLTIGFAIFLPQYGIDHAISGNPWQGPFVGKNVCAGAMVFLMTPAFFAPMRAPLPMLRRSVYIILALFVIVMTQSRTGLLVALLLLSFVIYNRLSRRFARSQQLWGLICVVSVGIALVYAIATNWDIFHVIGKDATLSGRTEIWSAVILSAMKHPILGYGYMAFWNGLQGESANVATILRWMPGYAHNGFLEVLLQLGFVGLTLIVVTLVSALRDAVTCIRYKAPSYVSWYISILVLTIIYNVDEGTLLFVNQLSWIVYVVACLGLSAEARRVKALRKAVEQESAALVPEFV
jgi:exopolysaccharide production protein ExoQ